MSELSRPWWPYEPDTVFDAKRYLYPSKPEQPQSESLTDEDNEELIKGNGEIIMETPKPSIREGSKAELPPRKPNYRGLGRATIIGRLPSGLPITENALLFDQTPASSEVNEQEE